MFSAISYVDGQLRLLDQRLLPHSEEWLRCGDVEEVAVAIETMVVRGAPAIACAAAYGLVLDVRQSQAKTWGEYASRFQAICTRLAQTRPTAVNLFHLLREMETLAAGFALGLEMAQAAGAIEDKASRLFAEDLATCQKIGAFGLEVVGAGPVNVMTHCNTGSLATAGYGTALGVIRSLHAAGKLSHVFVDETRPFLQGARLTAYELMKEGIPHSLNVDGAAAFLMSRNKIDLVVVGADRIAANGDTANKIGTYHLAIAAHYHKVPFYVAAPRTTFDPGLASGAAIPVEERDPREVTHMGEKLLAPHGTIVSNPSFDVTPHNLIAGFITEKGVLRPPFTASIARLF